MTATIDILKDCSASWLPDHQLTEKWLSAALTLSGQTTAVNISLRFVDEEESQRLNREFRDKDSAKPKG